MTREQAKELLPIIQAFAEGKTIQDKIEGLTDWCDTDEINLEYNGQKLEHRIKPEPWYRPFESRDECWNEMRKYSDFGWVKYDDSICAIQSVSDKGITITDWAETNSFFFDECLENLTFTNGVPFGIKE